MRGLLGPSESGVNDGFALLRRCAQRGFAHARMVSALRTQKRRVNDNLKSTGTKRARVISLNLARRRRVVAAAAGDVRVAAYLVRYL